MLTPGWDPAKYLEFAGHRLRPALDLLARVPAAAPAVVHDLGCGAGNVTRLLVERWPGAAVTGVDGSAAMLASRPGRRAERWRGSRPTSRTGAAPGPPTSSSPTPRSTGSTTTPRLFPRLVSGLAPGGTLAVQMPRNHGAPSHTEMVAAAEAGPWRERLRPALRTRPVADPAVYHDILASHVSRLDIWETEYLHALEGDNPVVEWTRGSALKPLLDHLEEPERSGFLAEYSARIARAYPRRARRPDTLPLPPPVHRRGAMTGAGAGSLTPKI